MVKPNGRDIRIGSLITVVCLVVLLLVNDRVQSYFLMAIKKSLDFEPTYNIVMAISLLIGLFYSFYFAKSSRPNDLRLFMKVFGPLIDPPLNSLAYGVVIASVLRLFRGIFNQMFFEIIYFKDFGFINVGAIGLACIPLLIWSVSGLAKYLVPLLGNMGNEFAEVTPVVNNDEHLNDQTN